MNGRVQNRNPMIAPPTTFRCEPNPEGESTMSAARKGRTAHTLVAPATPKNARTTKGDVTKR